MESNVCQAVRVNGTACTARPMPGSAYCLAHDPAHRERVAEGSRQGGRNRSAVARAARLIPPDLQSVKRRLLDALEEVHEGGLKPAQASAMAHLSGAIVKLHETGQLEARLADLERKLAEHRDAA